MPEDQALRRNPHLGTACPTWCRTDHARQFSDACIGGGGSIGSIWALAVRDLFGFKVALTGIGDGEDDDSQYVSVPVREAGQLAGSVELHADATPDQHRELAAAIRQAAADIAAGGQP